MFRVLGRVTRGFCLAIYGLVAVMAVLAVTTDPADARSRRKRWHGSSHASRSYGPPYAAVVVDVNSGKVLHESSADSLRHPASLTKIMTLYLLFERLEAGKMKLNTSMPVSAHAAAQAPTKLGLKPGQSLEVEDAIRGLVTKSANDAAVVVAEAIAGDEEDFAALMTRKARSLGMSRTTYRNASGLPDSDQVTTARDQALLGRAIQERFPRYYRYFSTSSFTYRGESMRNHNRLLGRVEGVDGIKTGFTAASGFNLVTSVRRNGRHIVAVVLGGRSAGARDARMRDLIETQIVDASVRRTAPTMFAEAQPSEPRVATRSIAPPAAGGFALASASSVPVAPRPLRAATPVTGPYVSAPVQAPVAAAPVQAPMAAAPVQAPKTTVVAARAEPPAPAPSNQTPGSTDPIRPIAVKTIKVKLATAHVASLGPSAVMIPVSEEAMSTQSVPAKVVTRDVAREAVAEAQEAPRDTSKDVKVAAAPAAAPPQAPWPTPKSDPPKSAWPSLVSAAAAAPAPKAEAPAAPARAHTGWIIQVGAFDAVSEAKQRLDAAQSKAGRLLSRADAFTETVTKGDKKLYRARFAGLDRGAAEAACKYLKRNEIACMTIKN